MIDCYVAAICRALSEGKDFGTYFGSTAVLEAYREEAERLGMLDSGELTEIGRRVGEACQGIPAGRAYGYARKYEQAALNAAIQQS